MNSQPVQNTTQDVYSRSAPAPGCALGMRHQAEIDGPGITLDYQPKL